MSDRVIRVEHLSKRYRLGLVGHGALHEDLSGWWARIRGRQDPALRVDQAERERRVRGGGLAEDAMHVWALRDVSFEVKRGDVLGIIGRNGAGKSTLLKILSRVTAPTSGEIRLKGRVASLLEVGTGFHPELSGRDNIYLNGAILGMTRRETAGKFEEIVDFSGCGRYIDTPVKRYSSGMYVRLAFAVAAHLDPEILIVDEVLAVGDAEFQKKCLGKMKDVAGHGRTVLFVSHNMGSVERLCTSCLLIEAGAIVRSGSPRDITTHYLAAVVGGVNACDFSKRLPRASHQAVRMTSARVFARGGQEQEGNIVRVGEEAVFEVRYRAEGEIGDVTIFFCLRDGRDDTLALHVNTRMSVGAIRGIRGEGVARCVVPRFALTPGDYRLDVGILSGSTFVDREENAMVVRVVSGDFFGTGYIPSVETGRALFAHRWEFEE